MANNTNIRKIPLLGSCDLTNFKTDIHDYEGFEQDNSFFLNKRKINWWKRNVGKGEIGGGVRGVVNGDYFDVYKDNAFIGKVSRQYYKKEQVSADTWRGETLQKVKNPYPQNNNKGVFINGQYFGKNTDIFLEQCGNKYFIGEREGGAMRIRVLNSDLSVYDSFLVAPIMGDKTFHYVGFLYRAGGYTFSYTFTDTTWKHPTFSFTVPDGYVYLFLQQGDGSYKEGVLYNIATKEVLYNTSSQYRFLTVSEGFKNFAPDANIGNSGAKGYRKSAIDYGEQYLYYDISVIDNNFYVSIYSWFSGYDTNELKLFFNSALKTTVYPGRSADPFLELQENRQTNKLQNQYILTFFSKIGDAGTIQFSETWGTPNAKFVQEVLNYSKKFGKWAVNFIENHADNIAHDYKKLFQIESDEDASGNVLAIDGYNDTYIYFHYGSNYYRISIATADNFADVVQSLNNVYFIFNTVSYLNAYYAGGDDWFCSCDDWNDRLQWYSETAGFKEVQVTSRLNNNWQTKTDVVSVSEMIAPQLQKISVMPDTSTMQAYTPGSTWNGTDIIYTASGTRVDTSSWTIGHSLNGYYFAQTYISQPVFSVPFFIDPSYTCPVYLDQNLLQKKQAYTVYFPSNPPHNNGAVSLTKQGAVSVDGWSVLADSGDSFAVPSDNSQYQRTPALLDTQYLVYVSSVIIRNNGGNYIGLTSARLGGIWTLIFLNKDETDPLRTGDSVFIINGIEYTYRAEPNRILDYNGNVVCNTYMLKYIGFSTHCAYFYSDFDRAVYIFEGDNAVKKLIPLERYELAFSVYQGTGKIDTLNISSLDVVIVNLNTAVLILFAEQYVIIETGKVNSWSVDEERGTFIVNGIMYSLIKSSLAFGNYEDNEIVHIPIEFETQFYGNPDNESNTINDCVYLTVDNLQSLAGGEVSLKAESLCNGKIVKSEEKIMKLKNEDFNELSQLLIKYQPKLQECKGLKLFVKSDFEVAELKIGTSTGAMNQTTKRI